MFIGDFFVWNQLDTENTMCAIVMAVAASSSNIAEKGLQ